MPLHVGTIMLIIFRARLRDPRPNPWHGRRSRPRPGHRKIGLSSLGYNSTLFVLLLGGGCGSRSWFS